MTTTTAAVDDRLLVSNPGIHPRHWYRMSWHQRRTLVQRMYPPERDVETVHDLDRPRRTSAKSSADEARPHSREERIKTAVELRLSGMTRIQIAESLHLSPTTVRTYLREAGLTDPDLRWKLHRKRERDERAAYARRLRKSGHSIGWIARELSVTERAVHRYLKESSS